MRVVARVRGAGLVLSAAADAEPTALPGSIFTVPLQQNRTRRSRCASGSDSDAGRWKAMGNAKQNGLKDSLGEMEA